MDGLIESGLGARAHEFKDKPSMYVIPRNNLKRFVYGVAFLGVFLVYTAILWRQESLHARELGMEKTRRFMMQHIRTMGAHERLVEENYKLANTAIKILLASDEMVRNELNKFTKVLEEDGEVLGKFEDVKEKIFRDLDNQLRSVSNELDRMQAVQAEMKTNKQVSAVLQSLIYMTKHDDTKEETIHITDNIAHAMFNVPQHLDKRFDGGQILRMRFTKGAIQRLKDWYKELSRKLKGAHKEGELNYESALNVEHAKEILIGLVEAEQVQPPEGVSRDQVKQMIVDMFEEEIKDAADMETWLAGTIREARTALTLEKLEPAKKKWEAASKTHEANLEAVQTLMNMLENPDEMEQPDQLFIIALLDSIDSQVAQHATRGFDFLNVIQEEQ